MPLTPKGEKIMASMKKQYGSEKGEDVFYASENKGTIKGVHKGKKRHRKRGRERALTAVAKREKELGVKL